MPASPSASSHPISAVHEPAQQSHAPAMLDVSIVIPVFNKLEFTKVCLERIDEHTTRRLRWEVVVVDNASSDGTAEFLKDAQSKYPWLRIISNVENAGFSRACNQGASSSDSRTVLLLNNDTEVQPGWMEPLVRTLYSTEFVHAVGAKLLFPDRTIQHVGVILSDIRPHADPLAGQHIYYKMSEDHPEANVHRIYPALTAACLLVRRDVWKRLQGLDEGFWNGYEDVDFCLRINAEGGFCVYEPSSVIIHHESQSGPERFRQVEHNVKRLHAKWLGKVEADFLFHESGDIERPCVDGIRSYPFAESVTFDEVVSHLHAGTPLPEPACTDGPSATSAKPRASIATRDSYHVVLVKPEGYMHSYAFQEVAELLVESLKSLGMQAHVGLNVLDPCATNIVLGYNLVHAPEELLSFRHIIFQLEQLSDREGWFRPELAAMLSHADEVWDYSPENIAFLAARGIPKVKHVPIGFHEKLRRVVRKPQDIDVLFYGSINERRERVLTELSRACNVKCLVGVYGAERDDYIARSKIILNLHYYEAQIQEQVRLAYLLNNRCFVISETSPSNAFGDSLVTCSLEEMADTCRFYLENDAQRYQRAKSSHMDFRKRPMTEYLRDVLGLSTTTAAAS